jgi:catechol 2,3-dioxygenase-like lactoylglutathione lyase family enzyme
MNLDAGAVRIRSLVPLARVRSVAASIEFYRLLGFEVGNTFAEADAPEPSWAYLVSGGAHLMLGRADEPVASNARSVLFYVYCDDVGAMREGLLARGVAAGPIRTPFYAPAGEFRIEDPDGYVVMVTHV